MSIIIPVWILWVLGGIAILAILVLAALGILFCWIFKDGCKISW